MSPAKKTAKKTAKKKTAKKKTSKKTAGKEIKKDGREKRSKKVKIKDVDQSFLNRLFPNVGYSRHTLAGQNIGSQGRGTKGHPKLELFYPGQKQFVLISPSASNDIRGKGFSGPGFLGRRLLR